MAEPSSRLDSGESVLGPHKSCPAADVICKIETSSLVQTVICSWQSRFALLEQQLETLKGLAGFVDASTERPSFVRNLRVSAATSGMRANSPQRASALETLGCLESRSSKRGLGACHCLSKWAVRGK